MRMKILLATLSVAGLVGWMTMGHPAHATSCGCFGDHLELTLVESTCDDCEEISETGSLYKSNSGITLTIGELSLNLQEL